MPSFSNLFRRKNRSDTIESRQSSQKVSRSSRKKAQNIPPQYQQYHYPTVPANAPPVPPPMPGGARREPISPAHAHATGWAPVSSSAPVRHPPPVVPAHRAPPAPVRRPPAPGPCPFCGVTIPGQWLELHAARCAEEVRTSGQFTSAMGSSVGTAYFTPESDVGLCVDRSQSSISSASLGFGHTPGGGGPHHAFAPPLMSSGASGLAMSGRDWDVNTHDRVTRGEAPTKGEREYSYLMASLTRGGPAPTNGMHAHSMSGFPPPLRLDTPARAAGSSALQTGRLARQRHGPVCELCGNGLLWETHGAFSVYILTACGHVFCRSHIKSYIWKAASLSTTSVSALPCPVRGCARTIAASDVRTFIDEKTYSNLLDKELHGVLQTIDGHFLACPNPGCDAVIEVDDSYVPKVPASFPVMVDGVPLLRDAWEHRERNRFRCRACGNDYCKQCKTIPYHLGKSCEEHSAFMASERCRFCGKGAPCGDEDCAARAAAACPRTLACGHPCAGVSGDGGEWACPPCLHESCAARPSGVPCGDEFCNICFVEPLSAAPVLRLSCGHIFHESCLNRKLVARWPSARITFNFMSCPLCKARITHPALAELLKPLNDLRDEIRRRLVLRVKYEGLDKSGPIADRTSEYYNDPLKYGEAMLCYYLCCKCKRPYFGGLAQCEAMGVPARQGPDQPSSVKEDELVCPECVPGSRLACPKRHGQEFLEYKCRFCCSIACYYCWGTTHFCQSCHKQQEGGDYLTRKKKVCDLSFGVPLILCALFIVIVFTRQEDLPGAKCPRTVEGCPLGVAHPPAGEEFALGCGLCRRDREIDRISRY